MEIFLVGMPGSGKSTVGKQLSELLNLKFIDLDHEIVEREKKEIADIFQEEGETYFRKLEATILRRIISSEKGYVLSTGGGTPCFFDNMNQMNNAGKTVFLDIDPIALAERVNNDNGKVRPLLKSANEIQVLEKLTALSQTRRRYYEMASISIDAQTLNLEALTTALQSSVKN